MFTILGYLGPFIYQLVIDTLGPGIVRVFENRVLPYKYLHSQNLGTLGGAIATFTSRYAATDLGHQNIIELWNQFRAVGPENKFFPGLLRCFQRLWHHFVRRYSPTHCVAIVEHGCIWDWFKIETQNLTVEFAY